MVEGTVYLSSGQTVTLYAGDMLTALKMATGTYYGLAMRMDFKTVEVSNTDGGCEVDQTRNGVTGQQENQADSETSAGRHNRADVGVSDVPCRGNQR